MKGRRHTTEDKTARSKNLVLAEFLGEHRGEEQPDALEMSAGLHHRERQSHSPLFLHLVIQHARVAEKHSYLTRKSQADSLFTTPCSAWEQRRSVGLRLKN